MRQSFFAALISCVSLLAVAALPAQAQSSLVALTTDPGSVAPPVVAVVTPAPADATAAAPATPAALTAPEAATTMVLTGHVKTAAGPLPGAVVKITASKAMVVTDADGFFHVTVPVATGPVQATASYAGFADENVTLDTTTSELSMTTPQVVKTAQKQQLKTYLKTARKQSRKSLKRVRR